MDEMCLVQRYSHAIYQVYSIRVTWLTYVLLFVTAFPTGVMLDEQDSIKVNQLLTSLASIVPVDHLAGFTCIESSHVGYTRYKNSSLVVNSGLFCLLDLQAL